MSTTVEKKPRRSKKQQMAVDRNWAKKMLQGMLPNLQVIEEQLGEQLGAGAAARAQVSLARNFLMDALLAWDTDSESLGLKVPTCKKSPQPKAK